MADSCELLEFHESRNPFSDNCSLRSISTGINAGNSENLDHATYVGEKILTSMAQRKVLQHSFKKIYQAVTLSTSAVKLNNLLLNLRSPRDCLPSCRLPSVVPSSSVRACGTCVR